MLRLSLLIDLSASAAQIGVDHIGINNGGDYGGNSNRKFVF